MLSILFFNKKQMTTIYNKWVPIWESDLVTTRTIENPFKVIFIKFLSLVLIAVWLYVIINYKLNWGEFTNNFHGSANTISYANTKPSTYTTTKQENYSNGTYLVKKVEDWDTITINYNWKDTKVRLIGIDAPEAALKKMECHWTETKDFLKNLVEWKKVKVTFDKYKNKTDMYWRLLSYVEVNWIDVWELMLNKWYVYEFTYNNEKYEKQTLYKSINNKNKENKKGIFLTCNWKK